MKEPKLRNVQKYKPPYPLNNFPKDFALNLGREVVYHLASRGEARLEGSDWEKIFALLVGANWKPSNVGLDDIVLEQTAWGAKSVKAKKPAKQNKVRLISGRNSPVYSYGDSAITECDPNELGCKVLTIWNERVTAIRRNYKHVRTVVLIKSDDLLELAVFEFDTILYRPELFKWTWNKNNNLEGFDESGENHIFTWQPHGSQFTIIEKVPEDRLALKVKKPPLLSKSDLLDSIGFDKTWVEIL